MGAELDHFSYLALAEEGSWIGFVAPLRSSADNLGASCFSQSSQLVERVAEVPGTVLSPVQAGHEHA
jgi:hypothetical protein